MRIQTPTGQILEVPDNYSHTQIGEIVDDFMSRQQPMSQPLQQPQFSLKTEQERQAFAKQNRENFGQNLAGATTGAVHGISFGFDDEAMAHATALYKKQFGTPQEKETSYKDLYSTEKNKIQQAQQQIKQEAPIASLAGEIGGSIAGGLGATKGIAKTGQALQKIPQLAKTGQALVGATQAGGIGKTALQGASAGALYGVGEAQNMSDIPTEALQGAAFGVAGNLAGKAIGGTVKGGLQKLLGVDNEAIKAYQAAGVNPSLAEISTSPTVKRLQNLLGAAPLSSDVIQKARDKAVQQIENNLYKTANFQGGTIQEAGEQIQQAAISKQAKIKATSDKLYNNVDRLIPKDRNINIGNVQNTLQGTDVGVVAKYFEGAAKDLINKLENINSLPYNEVRALRTSVGNKLNNISLEGDQRGALKAIYGALTKDLRTGAEAQGEKALQAFDKANQYFAKSQQKLEQYINPLIEKDTPDKVFNLAFQGQKTGSGRIAQTMKILNPEQKDFVRGSVIRKMGMATPGQQNATGELFSPDRFLTNWNTISPEAKKSLFSPAQLQSIDTLNQVIEKGKNVSKLQNKSNNIPYLTSAVEGALTWHNPAVGIPLILSSVGAAHLMTKPQALNWLVSSPVIKKTPINEIKNATKKWLNEGVKLASRNPEIAEDIYAVLNPQISSQEQQINQNEQSTVFNQEM